MPANSRDGHLPEYDAWRAERNRIDEARINRQRTAEGNWRREWDSNKVRYNKIICININFLTKKSKSKKYIIQNLIQLKLQVNIEKESSKKEQRFSSDTSRRDYKEFEKRHQFEGLNKY